MNIIEQFTRSKSGKQYSHLNEDGYAITEDWVAVFDGETDKYNRKVPSASCQAVRALAKFVPHLDASYGAAQIVKALHRVVGHAANGCAHPPGVAAAVMNLQRNEIVCVGDIWVGIDGVFQTQHGNLEDAAAHTRAVYMRTLIEQHGTCAIESLVDDPGRQIILPLLQQAAVWRNNPSSNLGFGTIDGTETPSPLIEVIKVPSGSEVVLATDGYFDPRETLAASEEVLRQSLAYDPLRIGVHAATKPVACDAESYDDRTYVRLCAP